MPIASLSVSQDLLGPAFTSTLGGDWFAQFTAALMLGAATGGILLGSLGDVIGRTRALGISVLFYSLFAGMGAFVFWIELVASATANISVKTKTEAGLSPSMAIAKP